MGPSQWQRQSIMTFARPQKSRFDIALLVFHIRRPLTSRELSNNMAEMQDTVAGAPMDVDDAGPNSSAHQQQTFHIGTRQSLLARVQTDEVVKALKQVWPDYKFEVHAMSTTGDNNQRTALHKFNDKALWTQELEVLLQSGELDLIVHSLKDMPTQLPVDLDLGCITKRSDPRDALVIKPSLRENVKGLADLPDGAVVGTSSLRRIAQLKRQFPKLKYTDVRGNIGTRLRKLDDPDSEYSAIILAAAGLQRMGMLDRVSVFLSKDNGGMLHAVGQGALGIETRKGDTRVEKLLSRIGCDRTARQALAERSLMRTLEGGCSVPIGVETEWVKKSEFITEGGGIGVKPAEDYHALSGVATSAPENSTGPPPSQEHPPGPLGTQAVPVSHTVNVTMSAPQPSVSPRDDENAQLSDELIMHAIVSSLDGTECVTVEARKMIASIQDADQFGRDVAKMLVEKGADKILESIELNRGIIHEQGDA